MTVRLVTPTVGGGRRRRSGVYWRETRMMDTRIVDGLSMSVGSRIDGPVIVEFPATTVVVRPNQCVTRNQFGDLTIALGTGVAE